MTGTLEPAVRREIEKLRAWANNQPDPADLLHEGQVMEVEDALAAYVAEPSRSTGHRLNEAVSLLAAYDQTPPCGVWITEVWHQACVAFEQTLPSFP